MNNKRKIVSFILAISVIAAPALALADFNPNTLITDKKFSDTQTFGSASGIQQFLESKHSVLASKDPAFLLMLKEPQDVNVKTGLDDPEPNLGRLRTAAELIWDAAQKTGINPQVIIVTLQKEQTLITGTFTSDKLQRALDHALGFGCPDSGGCDGTFNGFYAQMFGGFDAQSNRYIGAAGSLMRSFNTPGGRGPAIDAQNQTFGSPTVRNSRVGDTITLQNTMGNPDAQPQQSVTLNNAATAALYRYTPHVYNGNYNFWKFFDQWFRYANGTLLKLQGDANTYIINNGLKSLIPNFVMTARGLNPATTITVSPGELSDIDAGPLYGPADNTIIRDANNKLFVFQDSQKHPASSFVLQQRGLNTANAISVAQNEADLFQTASLLTPKEGTLITGDQSKTVYVIQNQQRMILSGFTFKQYGYAFKNVVTLPQSEVDQYTLGNFLLPKDGTVIKMIGSDRVYMLQNGVLHPVSATVFKLRHFTAAQVVSLNSGELTAANVDGYLAPPDGTYFRTSDGAVYYYRDGSKHYVSAFVFKQRRPAVVALSDNEARDMNDGMPLAPKDGTLIKGDQSGTIFVIVKGQKVALDYNTWVKKYRKAKLNVLSQAEVDSFAAPGDIEQ